VVADPAGVAVEAAAAAAAVADPAGAGDPCSSDDRAALRRGPISLLEWQPVKIKLAYASLCLIWGSTWMAIRVLVQDVPPLRAAWVRFLLAATLLGGSALVWRLPLPATRREWRAVLLLSVTMMAVPYGLIFWAEQYVTSSLTAVLFSTAPLLTALLTPVILGKPVARGAILALLVAVGGVTYLFRLDLTATPQTLVGGTMVLLAVLSSAFSSVYAKRETLGVHPVVTTTVQLAAGSLFLMALSAWVEADVPSQWTPRAVRALMFLAVFGSAVAFVTYYWLLRHMSVHKANTVNLVVPFVAILEGALLLQELITWHMFVASVVVLGAVGFVLTAGSDAPITLRSGDEAADPE
jgi:drug/metabolite transporter (DMT)-like permease